MHIALCVHELTATVDCVAKVKPCDYHTNQIVDAPIMCWFANHERGIGPFKDNLDACW